MAASIKTCAARTGLVVGHFDSLSLQLSVTGLGLGPGFASAH